MIANDIEKVLRARGLRLRRPASITTIKPGLYLVAVTPKFGDQESKRWLTKTRLEGWRVWADTPPSDLKDLIPWNEESKRANLGI
jgi:hypothetical protein